MTVGCIADDLTGATDIAATLSARGLRTELLIGPGPWPVAGGAQASVIALKSRTAPVDQAVAESLAGLEALVARGAPSFIFKYCSTFDSTPEGNIGPVGEALLDRLGQDLLPVCPSFPANGRTVENGQLLVHGVPLDRTGMASHPLTPMRSADVARLLEPQVRGRVGRVELADVRAGSALLRQRFRELAVQGVRFAVLDAVLDTDLEAIGAAASELALVSGSSAVALSFPAVPAGLEPAAAALSREAGGSLVVAGSCSVATLEQVESFAARHPSHRLDVSGLLLGEDAAGAAVEWARAQSPAEPILVYSSSPASELEAMDPSTRARASVAVERALAEVAARVLGEREISKLIVAGGETAGAVAAGLGVSTVEIGPLIDPGVPWTVWRGESELAIAFKSGNFGAPDFFDKALEVAW